MTGTYDWNDRQTIELSQAAIVILGRTLFESYQNDYEEFKKWGPAAEEAVDELCCALELQSVFAPASQTDAEFWKKAEAALIERTK